MSRITYRANLAAKSFPFLSRDQGRSVIVAGPDQNYSRYANSSGGSDSTVDRDIGIPQLYYGHDFLPVDGGITSVGYAQHVGPVTGKTFVNAWSVRAAGEDFKIAVTDEGDFYICSSDTLAWELVKTITEAVGAAITVAIVRDETYIQIAGADCYIYGQTVEPTSAPTAEVGDSGTLTGDYLYAITYVTAEGETALGTVLASAVTAAAQKIELTEIPVSGDSRVTGRKIYRTTADDSETYYLLATLEDNTTTTFSDNVADSSLGDEAPSENTTTVALEKQSLTGLTDGDDPVYPQGLTTYSGYLLAWTEDAFYWSSTIDPTDFTPDLATGAGGGQVEAAKGKITFVSPFASGLYLFTDKNTVSALYSNNVRYPFVFKEIAQSGGLANANFVAKESLSVRPIAYTSSGLQRISTTAGAEAIFPQLTDFLASSQMEDWFDGALHTVSLTDVMQKALAYVGDRYLVISYGAAGLTHAVVFDTALERWGKLRKDHVAVIEWDITPPEVAETPKNTLALLQADGTILTVSVVTPASAVAIFGKYQYVRQRTLQLQEIVAENISADCVVTAMPAVYGKTTSDVAVSLIRRDGEAATYGTNCVGTNISLRFEGTFSLTSLVLSFNIHGAR